MAKRKHVAKRHHYGKRRHRVGAVGTGLMEIGTAIVGAVAGRVVYNMATKVSATTGKAPLNNKVAAGIVTAGGILIKKVVRGPMASGFGIGMAAYGGVQLTQSLGILNGLPSSNMVAGYLSSGSTGSENLIAGPVTMKQPSPGMGMVGALVDEC